MKLGLLVLTAGKQEGKLLDIKLPQFLIGRDPQCHLRPASPLISKRHCALIQREGRAFIRDFGSTNGTFVNDDPVQGERELLAGDRLKVGPIEFVVQLEADEEATAGSPQQPQQAAAAAKTPKPATKAVTSSSKTPAPATKAAIGKPATTTSSAAKPDSTPIPGTNKPAAAAAKSGDDDDIAAMLLSLEEDGDSSSSSSTDGPSVPDGSTIMEIKLPPEILAGGKPGEQTKAASAKPATPADTRSAAARILEKMTKRPRA